MIDLKDLEAEIDSLLLKETTESLNNWFISQTDFSFKKYLGQGCFIAKETISYTFDQESKKNTLFSEDMHVDCNNDKAGNTSYAMAA